MAEWDDATIELEAESLVSRWERMRGMHILSGDRPKLLTLVGSLSRRIRDEQREAAAKQMCAFCRFKKYGDAVRRNGTWVHFGTKDHACFIYCDAARIREQKEG